MYDLEKLAKAEGWDEDATLQEKKWLAMSRANESAQITAAIQDSRIDQTVVLEIEVFEPEEFNAHVSPDESCPKMADVGAVQIPSKVLNKLEEEGKVRITAHYFRYYSRLSLFYIAGLWDSEYLNGAKEGMFEATLQAWEILYKSGVAGDVWETLLDAEEIIPEKVDVENWK